MSSKYEKDGIVYFNPPIEVDYSEWLSKHLDYDSIIKRGDNSSDNVVVICYASSSSYNKNLRDLRDAEYSNDKIMHGLSSTELKLRRYI